MPELVDLVVENHAVTEGPGRKLEVLGLGIGVGPVGGQEVGRVATRVDAAECPNGISARFDPWLVQGRHPHDQGREAVRFGLPVDSTHDQ
jgi:hypothetical protein